MPCDMPLMPCHEMMIKIKVGLFETSLYFSYVFIYYSLSVFVKSLIIIPRTYVNVTKNHRQ